MEFRKSCWEVVPKALQNIVSYSGNTLFNILTNILTTCVFKVKTLVIILLLKQMDCFKIIIISVKI